MALHLTTKSQYLRTPKTPASRDKLRSPVDGSPVQQPRCIQVDAGGRTGIGDLQRADQLRHLITGHIYGLIAGPDPLKQQRRQVLIPDL